MRRVTLVMAVWVRRQMYILPQAFLGKTSSMIALWWLPRLTSANNLWMSLTSLTPSLARELATRKTVGFVIAVEAQPLTSRGVVLQQVSVDKLLGVLIPMDNQPDRSLQDKRAIDAGKEIPAIVKLPIPLEEKAGLIALKTAGARYGLEIEEPTESVFS